MQMAKTLTLETVTTGYLIRRHRDGLLIPPGQDRAAMNRLFTWVVAAGVL